MLVVEVRSVCDGGGKLMMVYGCDRVSMYV